MIKEVKEGMTIMFHQTGNISNETEIILKGKVEFLELKSRINEIKIHLRNLTKDLNWQKKQLAALKIDRWRLCNLKKKEKKLIKKNEQSLRETLVH